MILSVTCVSWHSGSISVSYTRDSKLEYYFLQKYFKNSVDSLNFN